MITLRPLRPADVAVLGRDGVEPAMAGEFNWTGFKDTRLAERIEQGRVLTEHSGILAVETDAGELAGQVSWHEEKHGPGAYSTCWNIGIFLLPEHRGRGLGWRAQRRLAEYLFQTTPAARVEAGTEIGNEAEQRALARAGFTREGVLRQAAFRAGQRRDMVIFSRLRDEL